VGENDLSMLDVYMQVPEKVKENLRFSRGGRNLIFRNLAWFSSTFFLPVVFSDGR
jgi:hypothetical protein